MTTIINIPLEDLHDSPFNPRETYHEADDAEMVADIKAHGRVLEPLMVRPRTNPLFKDDPDGATGFEIVFGHRRKRNALAAGLASVPCMVEAMDDATARRMQISENLSRKDVHPMEEAKGFRTLIDQDGETATSIAEKFGKSLAFVYGRLKLLEACPEVRAACIRGEIGSETALLFARRPAPLQLKALEKIKGTQFYRARNGYTDGGKDGFRAVQEFLNEYFMLDLKEALWQLDDAELLPAAGACTTCPKRSGCSPELFADVVEQGRSGYRLKGGADVCTDPDCFADKKKAHLKRAANALEAKGQTVIAGAKARQIIGADGAVKGGYIEASKVRDLIKKAKADVTIATAQNPRDGRTKQVVKLEDLQAAGVKIAEPKATKSSGRGLDHEAERRKREAAAELQTKINMAILRRVRATVPPSAFGAFELRAAALFALDMQMYGEDDNALCQLYGVERIEELEKAAKNMTPEELSRLLLDCCFVVDVEVSGYGTPRIPERLASAAEHYGIDIDAVRAEVTGVAPTPSKAAPAAKKAPAAPAKATSAKAKKKAPAGPNQKVDAGSAGLGTAHADEAVTC